MAIVQLEDGRMADQFQIGDEPYVLKDSLVMMPADCEALTPEEIAARSEHADHAVHQLFPATDQQRSDDREETDQTFWPAMISASSTANPSAYAH
jgi:hypothetical protein